MKSKSNKKGRLSRRSVLPILGSTLLIPFLGMGKTDNGNPISEDEEYDILLRADGKAVKVRRSAIKEAKTVKKGVSNSSLLKWLGKHI